MLDDLMALSVADVANMLDGFQPPKAPLTHIGKFCEQRNKFSETRRKKAWSWQRIYDAYSEKYPKDKKASAAALRLSFDRNPDVR